MPQLHDVARRDVHIHLHATMRTGRRYPFNRKDMLASLERYVFAFRVDQFADSPSSSQASLSNGFAPFVSDEHLYMRQRHHPPSPVAMHAYALCGCLYGFAFAADNEADKLLCGLGDALRLTCSLIDERALWDYLGHALYLGCN